MAAQPRVLISGASVAGPVLAYWLQAFGFCPTVVERTAHLRAGGGAHAVDLFGPVLDVMDWMALEDQIGQARTTTEVMTLVRPGRRPVEAPMEMLSAGVSDRHLEIMRGDLAQIVFEATRGQVEYIFGDSVVALKDNGSRVDVTLEHADPRSFDLVVGAGGLHSTTRRLRFGPEVDFTRFLGGYLAVFTMPNRSRTRPPDGRVERPRPDGPGCNRSVTEPSLERDSYGAHPDYTMSTGTISTPSADCCDTCTATWGGRCRDCWRSLTRPTTSTWTRSPRS
jgi:2-polyprenyl-6-methoxyphenol hydroxylase-like FAD-dependent oxidoreductase